MKVFCYGASGHGKVVADILSLSGMELLGFVDDDRAKAGTRLAGVPVMGTATALGDLLAAGAAAIVTIGCNQARTAKAGELRRLGFKLATAIHPSAVVARDVTVGEGTVIMAGAIVNSGSRIGANVIINTAASVDHDCLLGDGVHISPGANLAGGVVIGSHTHVGIRASVIQCIQTGADSIIGAGAVVIRDIPSGVTAVGNPARILNGKNGMSSNKKGVFVSPDRSIRETLQVIDESGLAIALVVDPERHLLGTVTDGDVRRAILKGIDVALPVARIMNGAPLTVTPAQDIQQIRDLLLSSMLKHVPVVDNQNRVVDLITAAELLALPMSIPDITDRDIPAAAGMLRAGRTRSRSTRLDFEQKIAGYANRRYAVAVNSANSALHLLVRALGLRAGDEVITSPLSYQASVNCLLHQDAVPAFVDIDPRTCHPALDQMEARITPRTKAIMAVDSIGQPANYDGLGEIASRHGLALMVDASLSIGAEYKRRRASSYGVAAAFGFQAGSQIMTGEGGAIVTDDGKLAELCRSLRDQGSDLVDGEVRYERLGYNYGLADFNCALGLVQLERIDEILEYRQQLAELYDRLLEGCAALDRPALAPETTRMSWFAYVVCLKEKFTRADRDQVIARLGIPLNRGWSAIHLQPLYRRRFGFRPGNFPVTEAVTDRMLALPLHNHLRHDDVERVVEQLRSAIDCISLQPRNAKAGN
jgi:perosamine synthetase